MCIESETSRPSKFLKKYLYNKEILYRNNKSKILSVYKVLENLINHKTECKDFVSLDFGKFNYFEFPKNSTFFHYKHNLFDEIFYYLSSSSDKEDFLNMKIFDFFLNLSV